MAYTEEELMALIRETIEQVVSSDCLKNFSLSTRLVDICLDDRPSAGTKVVNSTNLIHVVHDLEEVLGICIPDDDFFALKTVGDIFQVFKRKLDSKERSARRVNKKN